VRGDGEAADRALERFVHCAEELRQPVFRMLAASALASRAIGRGEFDTADHHLAEMVDHARGAVSYVGAVEAGQRLWIAFQRGDLLDAGPELLEAGVELARRHTGSQAYAGLLHVLEMLAAAHQEGRPHLAALAAENFDRMERDEHWMVAMGLLAIAVVRTGERSAGQALYAKLLPHRQLMLSHDLMRSVAGSVESPLGALALLCDRPDDAVAHFEAAQARERAMGLRPALVRSGMGLALALRLRGAPGDAARAERREAEARAEAGNLGMRLPAPLASLQNPA
jgi:hypothetical protein